MQNMMMFDLEIFYAHNPLPISSSPHSLPAPLA